MTEPSRLSVAERDAAQQFVVGMGHELKKSWPTIAEQWSLPDDERSNLEVWLAVVAVQSRALPNVLSREQADRIWTHILEFLSSTPKFGSYPRHVVQEYQQSWDQALAQDEQPHYAVASLLFDKLQSQDTVELGDAKFKSPLLLDILATTVSVTGGGWWKVIAEQFDIVP